MVSFTTTTGLAVDSYDARLGDLMQRLVVAPAASRYMFWQKVATVQQLRQRCDVTQWKRGRRRARNACYRAEASCGEGRLGLRA